MRTYPIRDPQTNITFAFEIENVYIGISTASKILSQINGVSNIRKRKPFSKETDIRIQFSYKNEECVMHEPFGDSSSA